jgi:hypothetical protein
MSLTLEPVRVAAGEDNEGLLVFLDGSLVAILVRLSDLHGEAAGAWFLEMALGRLGGPANPVFPDLDVAQKWISARLG